MKAATGATGRDAVVALRVGRLAQTDGSVLGDAVVEGSVSVPAAEAIRAGLEGADAPPELIAEATELLCGEASALDPDRLRKRAREVRDELDEAGIAGREAVLRGRRSLRRVDLRDGMKRLIWDYDPVTAGVVDEIYDRATSPRRGGPRFVDEASERRATELERDERTTEQIASDAFTELLRQSGTLPTEVLLGKGTPAVRVLVPAADLVAGTGHGVIEGTNESIAIGTVQALACANGTQLALVDSLGDVLDLGRNNDCSPATSGSLSPSGTVDASGPAANGRLPGVKRTISTTTPRAGAPTSSAGCCCAGTTTSDCTTRAGRSVAGRGGTGSTRLPTGTELRSYW